MTIDVRALLEQLRTAGPYDRIDVLGLFAPDDPATREALLAVRRHGPGRLRASALHALAHVAGEPGLDPADVALVERLVRIRLHLDAPRLLSGCWLRWWCVRSDDPTAVMASIGLHDPRPVTFGLADSVLETIEHCRAGQPLVFVGPARDGWTTITGPWCDVFNELPDHPARPAEARATVERLSAEFGEAHAFYDGERDDGSAWLVARDGATVRTFDLNDAAGCTGEPLAFELKWMDANGLSGRPEDHFDDVDLPEPFYDFFPAPVIAAEISDIPCWSVPTDQRLGLPVIATLPGFSGAAPFPPAVYTI
ncbi:hypothetical protein O7626_06635 [Micromonospora sp. WMMD1102]|uniref:hypothetical protein n=1 Tax=Micromonospora sp. WMMD1102 TaxID=3016105 RepID=UPI0024157D09|nr:hypothetical protein [Micromonospora sp. WMMD1102]MDG4785612.1 hypothetical protein [Micromonospora sp. WMMD1102]